MWDLKTDERLVALANRNAGAETMDRKQDWKRRTMIATTGGVRELSDWRRGAVASYVRRSPRTRAAAEAERVLEGRTMPERPAGESAGAQAFDCFARAIVAAGRK